MSRGATPGSSRSGCCGFCWRGCKWSRQMRNRAVWILSVGLVLSPVAKAENKLFITDVLKDERSEEHTSELQSLTNLVCRLLLEKKKKNNEMLDYRIACTMMIVLIM